MNRKSHRDGDKVYSADYRRKLRSSQTKAEQLVWAIVRDRRLGGYKFRRQYSVDDFIVDFVCLDASLIIEVDGGYHDYTIEQDVERDRQLRARGCQVFRVLNEEVLKDAESVARGILRLLKDQEKPPHPGPLPRRGEGTRQKQDEVA